MYRFYFVVVLWLACAVCRGQTPAGDSLPVWLASAVRFYDEGDYAQSARLARLCIETAAAKMPVYEMPAQAGEWTIQAAHESAWPQTPVVSGLPRLLLVEDNPDNAAYVQACLSARFDVVLAQNGEAGTAAAFEQVPDIVVSDVMMPLKDGYELCDDLKNDPRTSHIPVVLLTAKAATDDRITGLRRGADAYLTKPFHREELLALLETLLENRRRVQARYSRLLLEEPQALAAAPEKTEDVFLQKIRLFVEAQLANPQLSLDDICREAGMGRSNLHLKFSALAGMPPMQYVRALRLRKSRELIAEGELNISEVAFAVGFDDPKYFSRLFSEEYGMAPTQWRKSG